LNRCLRSSRLFYKGHLKSEWMPEGEESSMDGLGAFGDASTIVPDFQVAATHGVMGHKSC